MNKVDDDNEKLVEGRRRDDRNLLLCGDYHVPYHGLPTLFLRWFSVYNKLKLESLYSKAEIYNLATSDA